jgi:hypothetical protein
VNSLDLRFVVDAAVPYLSVPTGETTIPFRRLSLSVPPNPTNLESGQFVRVSEPNKARGRQLIQLENSLLYIDGKLIPGKKGQSIPTSVRRLVR